MPALEATVRDYKERAMTRLCAEYMTLHFARFFSNVFPGFFFRLIVCNPADEFRLKQNRAELPKTITKRYLFHVTRPKGSQSENHLLYLFY